MTRRRPRDPDAKTPTPFAVLRGEWWEDRKVELSEMNRRQLQSELDERGIGVAPEADLYWMRMRLAYAEQIQFHLERSEPVPDRMLTACYALDARRPAVRRADEVNIFYDPTGEGAEARAVAMQNRLIEAAIARDTQDTPCVPVEPNQEETTPCA
jgi:hypothetical protein